MKLPVKIIRNEESIEIRDANLTNIAYFYFEDDPGRRMSMKRMSEAEAEQLAKLFARTLTASS